MPSLGAIGAGAIGLFGGSVAAGSLTATVVGGALVGAAIGGISAAITGGDIGKGILFGAVGGAVSGAITYGLSAALNGTGIAQGMGNVTEGAASMARETGMSMADTVAIATDPMSIKGTTTAATQAAIDTAGSTGSGFLDSLKESMGGGFGQAAVSQGIGAVKDMYMGNKEQEWNEKQMEAQMQLEREKMASAERIAGMRGSGGGGGASGPDYTIDELIKRDLAAAGAERETVLAKVDAELQAQKELKNQELAASAAARERAAAGAGALKSTRAAGSRSSETLVDIQDRIRAGEGPAGDPNIGVVPPVEYVPPEQMA